MRTLIIGLVVWSTACVGPQVRGDRGLPPDVVENLQVGALNYSWSGPLKWSAITYTSASLWLLTTQPDSSSRNVGIGILAGSALIDVLIAVALDEAASESYDNATRAWKAEQPAVQESYETMQRRAQEIERRQAAEKAKEEPRPAPPPAPATPKAPITPRAPITP